MDWMKSSFPRRFFKSLCHIEINFPFLEEMFNRGIPDLFRCLIHGEFPGGGTRNAGEGIIFIQNIQIKGFDIIEACQAGLGQELIHVGGGKAEQKVTTSASARRNPSKVSFKNKWVVKLRRLGMVNAIMAPPISK